MFGLFGYPRKRVSKSAICVSIQHQRQTLEYSAKLRVPSPTNNPDIDIRFFCQNTTSNVEHMRSFLEADLLKLSIFVLSSIPIVQSWSRLFLPQPEGVFSCLFGDHVRASFGSESVRPEHEEQGLGVRGITKNVFPEIGIIIIIQGTIFNDSGVAIGSIFMTSGALDSIRDSGFSMKFACA